MKQRQPVQMVVPSLRELEQEEVSAAKLEKVRALVREWRRRADVAGPQAYAFTYRQCADELEGLLDG